MSNKERAALGLVTTDAPESEEEPDRTAVDHPPAAPIDPRTVRLRWSTLKHMAETPAHYYSAVQRECRITASMRKGTAIHSALLGDPGAVVVYPGKTRNGKVWESFKADQDPRACILIRSEAEDVFAMRAAIEAHRPASGPSAMELLSDGAREQAIEWERAGRACRGTPDVAGRRLVELKSCRTANPRWFLRDAERMLYHGQCAWYEDALGNIDRGSWIVAVGNTAPYVVQVYRLSSTVLDIGRLLAMQFMSRLVECERTGVFPGYSDGTLDWDSCWSESSTAQEFTLE